MYVGPLKCEAFLSPGQLEPPSPIDFIPLPITVYIQPELPSIPLPPRRISLRGAHLPPRGLMMTTGSPGSSNMFAGTVPPPRKREVDPRHERRPAPPMSYAALDLAEVTVVAKVNWHCDATWISR